jgi:hypothetical protein
MATDPVSGHVVLFGGDNGGVFADTWIWDGTNWTRQNPADSPSGRWNAGMAGDAATGRVVLFGGLDGNNITLAETWTWDGADWTQQNPATSPSAREGAAMAADPATDHVVLFGGDFYGSQLANDTWTWDGADWTQAHPATSPSARTATAMAADPAGRVLIFGGNGSAGYSGDTWSITPSLTITPNSGSPGTVVKVRGLGYTPGATVMVVKYRTTQSPLQSPDSIICSTTVGADTRFHCSGHIPTGSAAGALGPHDIVAKDTAGLKSRTQFLLT